MGAKFVAEVNNYRPIKPIRLPVHFHPIQLSRYPPSGSGSLKFSKCAIISNIPDSFTKEVNIMSIITILLIAAAVIFSLASLGGGIYCIVRYARTRKVAFLIVGLILTFVLPGTILCIALGVYIPSRMIVYGPPPPPTSIVYGPPPMP
jgi:hypothetical protein